MWANPTTWFEKPKWRNSGWFKVSCAAMLLVIALGNTTLVLTAMITARKDDWGGLTILVLTMVFITIAPMMLTLRAGDILFPPESDLNPAQSAGTEPAPQPATGMEKAAGE